MRGLGVTPLGMGCRRLRDPEETPAQEPASDAGNSRPCGRSASRVHLPAAETTQPPGALRMTSSGYASLSVIRVSVPPMHEHLYVGIFCSACGREGVHPFSAGG